MRVNLSYPHSLEIPAMMQPWEFQLQPPEMIRIMRLGDELGFHKLVIGEHLVIPEDHIELSGAHWLHGTCALAFAAGQTSRMGLASSISILPLQNPIVQAKAWSTLDWLSQGRATAVFGAGWLEGEFALLNVPFQERGAMCDEYLAAMIALWTQDSPAFEGKYVAFDKVGFDPKPVQKPHLPIWLGGDARPVLRRVARFADGWSPFLTHPDKFLEALDTICSSPEYDGRPLGLYFSISAMRIGEGHVRRDEPLAGGTYDIQETVDMCGWLAERGVTETLIPMPPLSGFEAYLDRLQWVGEEIIPRVAGIAAAR